MSSKFLFYIWFILQNGFVHYFTFDFLLCVAQKDGRRYLPVWLTVNSLITVIVTLFQLPGTFFIDVLILFAFAKATLNIRSSEIVAPITIIFTF